jgi:flagellar assembly protein FliH
LSDVIEQLAGAQRWQAPALSQGAAALPLHTAAQLDAMERAAYEEGFARGHAEGYAAGAQDARSAAQRLRELLDHCARPLDELDAEVEQALLELALQAARRLVQREYEFDPKLMGAAIHEAVAALATMPRELRVHLHPEDLRLLHDSLERPSELAAWRLVPDPALLRGDCRIASDSGWVDATLATREQSLARALGAQRAIDA